MHANEIATQIVDAAYRIRTRLGPGLLESVYEATMGFELQRRGLHVRHQQPIPVVHEAIRMEEGFRADLIVEHKVIIELKSIEEVAPSTRSSRSRTSASAASAWARSSTSTSI